MDELFAPALPEKIEAARNLPLGLDDKLFIALDRPEEFEKDSRLFGAKNDSKTAAYHIRPFGRADDRRLLRRRQCARTGSGGRGRLLRFRRCRIDAAFSATISPSGSSRSHIHHWGADPFARGAYSYALPGKADCRATLAAPVDDRLFFAGEACSKHDYSTAHGAYRTGIAAAEQVIAARK